MIVLQELSRQQWIRDLLQHTEIYVVGGCVRDTLMSRPIKDIDLLIEGKSLEFVKNMLRKYGRVDIVGESFSVLKFRPIGHTGEDYDIAVPRMDRKIGKGHKGFETISGVSLLEDLKRRDFTINSIAIDIKTGKIIDPFDGIEDLKKKLLRATNKEAFVEDPLRILRGIQFAARFKFIIEPHTLNLMKSNVHLIHEIPGERILDEFNKILLKNGSTKIAFKLIHDSGLDKELLGTRFTEGFMHRVSLAELDIISFFYMLCLPTGNPAKFYHTRLRGEAHITKSLEVIHSQLNEFLYKEIDETEFRWKIFMMLKSSLIVKYAKIFPPKVKEIFDKMKNREIPSKFGDIPVTGDDLMEMFDLTPGKELGQLIMAIYKDALMNKFDWKNREKTLKYLNKIR